MKQGLENSIKSLIVQNLKNDIEYIVVDGLSSDGSQDIIEQYREYIDKIVIEKDNGIFDAMNKGIDRASGEYIYFLNSGDEFAGYDVLKTVMEAIDNTESKHNIIYGDVATFRFGEYLGIANLYPWLVHQGAFVKTSLMKEYLFDTNFKIFGDLDLWRRLHKNNEFEYHTIDKTIANMEIDGIGSNPKYIFKRLKDKEYFAKKHNDYSNLLGSYILGISGYIIYKIFGEKFYYHHFFNITVILKKIIRKPFWALRRVNYKLYTFFSYPIYKLILKKYNFGSFIHPFSSIGNHNLLSIGKNVEINHNVTIWGDTVIIGDNTQINPGTVIYGKVTIGNFTMIAPNCMIAGGNHTFSDISKPMQLQGDNSKGISIEEDVWVGANSVILDGVTVKKGSVVAAGSIVTKDVEAYNIVAGNPAKVVRRRDSEK